MLTEIPCTSLYIVHAGIMLYGNVQCCNFSLWICFKEQWSHLWDQLQRCNTEAESVECWNSVSGLFITVDQVWEMAIDLIRSWLGSWQPVVLSYVLIKFLNGPHNDGFLLR